MSTKKGMMLFEASSPGEYIKIQILSREKKGYQVSSIARKGPKEKLVPQTLNFYSVLTINMQYKYRGIAVSFHNENPPKRHPSFNTGCQ